MPHSFPTTEQPALVVGRSPWTAADAPVGLVESLDSSNEGAGPGGPARTRGSAPQVMQHSGFGENYAALSPSTCATQSEVTFNRSMLAGGRLGRFRRRLRVGPGGLPGPRGRPLASRSKLRMARSRSSRCSRNSARALARSMTDIPLGGTGGRVPAPDILTRRFVRKFVHFVWFCDV